VGVIDNLADFASESPAATILTLLRDFGPNALVRLRGAFAAVISDGRRVWAARDHVGLEPLYYRADNEGLVVGSEVKQVAAAFGNTPRPDLEIVHAIFYGDPYDEARTAFVGISRLPKGSFLEWLEGSVRVVRYWDPRELLETGRYTTAEIQDLFDFQFTRAVRRVLTGHDAVSLSGGVDSAAIAVYGAAQHRDIGHRNLGAVSALYPDHPSVDESSRIQMLATKLDLDLHTFVPAPVRLDRLEYWVRAFDGPWSAWHPGASEQTYQQMRSLGFSNMLTGEFAEHVVDVRRGVVAHLLGRGRIRSARRVHQQQRLQGHPLASGLRQAASAFVPRPVAAFRRYRHPLAVIPPWMDADRIRRSQAANSLAPRNDWRKGQVGFLTVPSSSLEAYRMLQDRNGVRVRYPFADVDFWEFWLSLQAEIKHPDGRSKTLLRRLLRNRVPDEVLDAPKVVFNAYVTDRIDYGALRKWLVNSSVRLEGINYELLENRIDSRGMQMSEFMWAKDLAAAHAFLGLW
jgi:asparagine synthase (glutamine-hydrolysing)